MVEPGTGKNAHGSVISEVPQVDIGFNPSKIYPIQVFLSTRPVAMRVLQIRVLFNVEFHSASRYFGRIGSVSALWAPAEQHIDGSGMSRETPAGLVGAEAVEALVEAVLEE